MDLVEAAAAPPIPETLLRDWLKQIQHLVTILDELSDTPKDARPPKRLLEGLLETSYMPGLAPRHRAAACNFVCAIFDLSRVQKKYYVDLEETDAWRRMFHVFVDRSDVSMTKSMRQVLTTLTNDLKRSEKYSLRDEAVMLALGIIQDGVDHVRVRPAMQLVTYFLSKQILTLEALVSSLGHKDRSVSSQNADSFDQAIASLYDSIFLWINFNDLALPAAQLSTEIFKQVLRISPRESKTLVWERPLLTALSRSSKALSNFRNYLFPSLFTLSVSAYFQFLGTCGLHSLLMPDSSRQPPDITQCSDSHANDLTHELLYVSLQVGKEIGIVKDTEDVSLRVEENAFVTIPVCAIRKLMDAQSPTTRLAAVSLIISSPSVSSPFTTSTLSCLRSSLPLLIGETDASFRGDILSLIQRLIDRLRGASAQLWKAAKKETSSSASTTKIGAATTQLRELESFLSWLIQMALSGLHPAATYQLHYSCLRILTMLTKSGIDPRVASEYLAKQAQIDLKWPFSLRMYSPWAVRSLLDLLIDPYDDVRQSTAAMLSMSPTLLDDGVYLVDEIRAFLSKAEILMQQSGRADHADGVARAYALLFERLPGNGQIEDAYDKVLSKDAVFEHVLSHLDTGLATARKSLPEAVKASPLHGDLISLRYIIEGNDVCRALSSSDQPNLELWRSMFRRLYASLVEVWNVVSEILCSDAPEGYVLEESNDTPDMTTKDTLSYCWRALKESSSVMKALISQAPKLNMADENLFTSDDFELLGELSFRQLSELRHRGAFSTVAQTFAACCSLSSCAPESQTRALIQRWYERTIDAISDKASFLTRRSAGLPSLLTSILSADPEGPLFREAITVLVSIAQTPSPHNYERGMPLPQVHAMNCLRAVFINSKLGVTSEHYVLDGLHLAAARLGSPVWAIRNSALMLFRALLDRMLGTFESGNTDEAVTSARFSYSNFPTLLDVVEEMLSLDATVGALQPSSPEQPLAPASLEKVFPALHLLQRAPPPQSSRQRFLPSIVQLTGSSHWHVRDLAARTLVRLSEGFTMQQFEDLFSHIELAHPRHNELHGYLLALNYLLNYRTTPLAAHKMDASELKIVYQRLLDHSLQLDHENRCWITRDAYREVMSVLSVCRATNGTTQESAVDSDSVFIESTRSPFDPNMSPSATEIALVEWASQLSSLRPGIVTWISRAQDLQRLVTAVHAYLAEDNTFTLRFAAVDTLLALGSFWTDAITKPKLADLSLSSLFAVYDALNDDDEEIRDRASEVVQMIFKPVQSGSAQPLLSPPSAARRLMNYIVRRFNGHSRLCEEAVRRLTAGNVSRDGIKRHSSDFISKGFEEDTTLFVQEKQNLYIDPIAEAATWSHILKHILPTAIERGLADYLANWVMGGLEYLTQTAQMHPDAPLGWSSKPEVFTAGIQLLCAADVLLVWRTKTRKVPIAGSELRRKLFDQSQAGRVAHLHPMWLEKADLILQQATARRLALLRRSLSYAFQNQAC